MDPIICVICFGVEDLTPLSPLTHMNRLMWHEQYITVIYIYITTYMYFLVIYIYIIYIYMYYHQYTYLDLPTMQHVCLLVCF